MTDYELRLWDQYAGAALTGLLAESAHPNSTGWGPSETRKLATRSFNIAYAMMEERAACLEKRKE